MSSYNIVAVAQLVRNSTSLLTLWALSAALCVEIKSFNTVMAIKRENNFINHSRPNCGVPSIPT